MTGFYWIASYPKSGNTWLRLALRELVQPNRRGGPRDRVGFAPMASDRADIEEALDIDSSDFSRTELEALRPAAYRAMAMAASRPLYRKVHDARLDTAAGPLFPPDVTLGSVYVVRDPRDVAVSWAHFAGMTMDAAVAMLCDPAAILLPSPGRPALAVAQRLTCWSGHARSWLDAPGRPCCLVRYEDMLADPAAVLGRVSRYAGIAHGAADIERAVETTRFDTLREREIAHGFDGGQAGTAAFFRSGRAGEWQTALNPLQVARIEAAHGEMMTRLGYAMAA